MRFERCPVDYLNRSPPVLGNFDTKSHLTTICSQGVLPALYTVLCSALGVPHLHNIIPPYPDKSNWFILENNSLSAVYLFYHDASLLSPLPVILQRVASYKLQVRRQWSIKVFSFRSGKYFIPSSVTTRCHRCTVVGNLQLVKSSPKVKFSNRKCFITTINCHQ